jgi:hypothetical protein
MITKIVIIHELGPPFLTMTGDNDKFAIKKNGLIFFI